MRRRRRPHGRSRRWPDGRTEVGHLPLAFARIAEQCLSEHPWAKSLDGLNSMRLLIIEDDRDAAEYLVKALREVGHVADCAVDGEEGLALASDGHYDVLIVDRMLPKIDGLSVIGTLRTKEVDTPVLILSALGQVDDRVKGLRAGGDDYLPKPYSFSELLARVEVLARRHGGRSE